MTKQEIKQQLKNECLNRILFIHSKYFKYCEQDYSESYCEQRDYEIKRAIEKFETSIKNIKK